MRTILHISDLHFGRTDPTRVSAIHRFVMERRPDVIAVSGDLTQRARKREFAAAREFINSLPAPHVVIPGNHDVPLHNVFTRLLAPFAKYHEHFHEDLEPEYVDDELLICGLNSARGLTLKDGRLDRKQVEHAATRFRDRACCVKIVVAHHPFPGHQVETLAEAGADVFLTGHLHATIAEPHHGAIVVNAGTATSNRVRDENNAFNVLVTSPGRIEVEHMVWKGVTFDHDRTSAFIRGPSGWVRDPWDRADRRSA